ncbi:uncharacterized protein [Physcomitrium patens]|uniref:F-box domain-containing protein n=1 Tax=Physcomitrium patens TaxID=3218 RepID=A9S5M3_PHYPA|nr:uncharacterized protein LOC112277543 isoform X1 [Physcomitrium patens]XP_024365774.1 uncharacterized protein LOC112277543 isoform X1 [Physcomitrium patens]|eukprot:XP_024365773.1 uncharacterized protein LOC112277543 isoform X1 [Physcomitrella patens]
MARLSLEGTSKQNTLGALHRIGQVIRGFDNSLAELNEVETLLANETSSPGIDFNGYQEDGPDLQLVVSMLKQMVESLVADIKSAIALEVLLAMQDITQATDYPPRDVIPQKEPFSLLAAPGIPKAARISGLESVERDSGASTIGSGVCRHSCIYHAEVMDPWLWSRFPEHLLGLVFARLPLRQIFAIQGLSKTWQTTLKTSSFRRVCDEAHSKLFGMLGNNHYLEEFWVAAFDFKTHKWCYHALNRLPWVYRVNSMYAHDGGLVCFVPPYGMDQEILPILICNPITDDWRALPLIDLSMKQPLMVQLLVEAETSGCYKVMVVYRDRPRGRIAADCYDSEMGLWGTMGSGIVYGTGDTTDEGQSNNAPFVFDCTSGMLYDLKNHPSLQGQLVEGFATIRDRIFALYECECADPHSLTYEVSEFLWQNSVTELVKMKSYQSILEEVPNGYKLKLCSSEDYILIAAFNNEGMEGIYENRHQVLRVYDVATEVWHSLPVLNHYYTYEMLRDTFMCKLRWDAVP